MRMKLKIIISGIIYYGDNYVHDAGAYNTGVRNWVRLLETGHQPRQPHQDTGDTDNMGIIQ